MITIKHMGAYIVTKDSDSAKEPCAGHVHPPRIERANTLGIDVDAEYARMIDRICRAYSVRFKD